LSRSMGREYSHLTMGGNHLGWEMAWDLYWFRVFARCDDCWFDMIFKMIEPTPQLYDNDN
jgi:hypothetical protein